MSDTQSGATAVAVENPFREYKLNDTRDFRPEWDVPTLNSVTSDWLLTEVKRLAGRRTPDPGQRIPVLLSAGGRGKTHVFGRLAHALGNSAFFAFVGAIPNPNRPLEHIQYCVVESLFQAPDGETTPIALALAELFRDAFIETLQRLPNPAHFQPMVQALKQNPTVVLKIVAATKEMVAFQKLAQSAAAKMSHVRASVVRALVLGWSPQSHLARRWLRGEKLSEEEARSVGLEESVPATIDVLTAIAAVFDYRKPLVICLDQLESVLKDAEGPRQLATQLMELLAGVPAQFLILSCLEGDWLTTFRSLQLDAFHQRLKEFNLEPLKPEEGILLVKKRLQSWPQYEPEKGELWPLDAASVEEFILQIKAPPRTLINRCEDAINRLRQGSVTAPVSIGVVVCPPPVEELFVRQWQQELHRVETDRRRQPDDMQDARVFAAVKEAVELAKSAANRWAGLTIGTIKDAVLESTAAYTRYGLRVEIAGTARAHSVIAAVTTLTGGNALFYFVKELLKQMKTSAGAILLHPRSVFTLGAKGQDLVDEARTKGKLIVLSLKESRSMFHRLECAVGLLYQARSGELVLGSTQISFEECQRLLRDTDVLNDLLLFEKLVTWNTNAAGAEAARPSARPSAQAGRSQTRGKRRDGMNAWK